MAVIQNSNYVTLQGWMVNDLHLKGSDLVVFALIWGFAQDGETEFNGSLAYIQQWAGIQKKAAIEVLKRLSTMGLIEKRSEERSGVKRCYYRACVGGGVETTPGWCRNNTRVVSKQHQGGVETTPNNNNDNIYINTTIPPTPKFDFRKALLEAGVSASTADTWIAVRKAKRAVNSELALRTALEEIKKAGLTPEEGIKTAAANSWQGFKAEWVQKPASKATPKAPSKNGETGYMQRMMDQALRMGIIKDEETTPYDEQ